jgi:hypothetical protein
MTDGDGIPLENLVEVHYINKKKGYFIPGGYYKLPMNIYKRITKEDIQIRRCFTIH